LESQQEPGVGGAQSATDRRSRDGQNTFFLRRRAKATALWRRRLACPPGRKRRAPLEDAQLDCVGASHRRPLASREGTASPYQKTLVPPKTRNSATVGVSASRLPAKPKTSCAARRRATRLRRRKHRRPLAPREETPSRYQKTLIPPKTRNSATVGVSASRLPANVCRWSLPAAFAFPNFWVESGQICPLSNR
jgi:hypothetical protein